MNGEKLETSRNAGDNVHGIVSFQAPVFSMPNLSTAKWKYIDSLPEIESDYDDELWTDCNHTTSTNLYELESPTSLYAAGYRYHGGSLIYSGHFTSNGYEKSLWLNISKGSGIAHSVRLNKAFLGSWMGNGGNQAHGQTPLLPSKLDPGRQNVFTVVIDNMGNDEEGAGTDVTKFPKGIINYTLSSHRQTAVRWKMTGNLGGEQYRDHVRGPRNEWAMFAECQGFHQLDPPSKNWKVSNPIHQGISEAGIGVYSTSFEFKIPNGHDVPMSFVLNHGAYGGSDYRVQIFVNGYQFGKDGTYERSFFRLKYCSLHVVAVNNLGPQTSLPVPEGILDYNGINYMALALWSVSSGGVKLSSVELVSQMPVKSGYFSTRSPLSPLPKWQPRKGTY